jgi:hypothetical protein
MIPMTVKGTKTAASRITHVSELLFLRIGCGRTRGQASVCVFLGTPITTTIQDADRADDDGRKLGSDSKRDRTVQRRSEDMRDRSTDHNNHS